VATGADFSQGSSGATFGRYASRLSRSGEVLAARVCDHAGSSSFIAYAIDRNFVERAVQFIKGGYSYRLRKVEKIQVWQESFTNHRIRDAEDYERHCSYVRLNPVRAGLVRDAAAYPFSSAGSGVRMDAPQGLKPDFFKIA
jgi:hypothetical protein